MLGRGESILITGFVVSGGEPRNIVLRVLGPSLKNRGLVGVASDPELVLYRGEEQIAANRDWKSDARSSLLEKYPAIVPLDSREPALFLTLLPGAYTLHAMNAEGSAAGVALVEVFDPEAGAPIYHGQ